MRKVGKKVESDRRFSVVQIAPPDMDSTRKGLMLNLARRVGESIHIDDNIVVTVLAVNGSQIRLGIAAPRSVAIYREELIHCDRNDLQNLKTIRRLSPSGNT